MNGASFSWRFDAFPRFGALARLRARAQLGTRVRLGTRAQLRALAQLGTLARLRALAQLGTRARLGSLGRLASFALVAALVLLDGSAVLAQSSQSEIYPILHRLEALRELPLLRPVRSEQLDEDGLRAALQKVVDEDLPEEKAGPFSVLLETLELLPSGYDVREELVGLLGAQVAGFYDPEARKMFLVDFGEERLAQDPELGVPQLRRVTMAHELDHALTDQHFDLDKLLRDPRYTEGHDDLLFARHCLAEGDATLAMLLYFFEEQGLPTTPDAFPETETLLGFFDTLGAAAAGESAELQGVPPYLRNQLVLPYSLGLRLVLGRWKSGGWAAVDALWQRPPLSSEQLLHPERASDEPTPMREEALAPGWTRLHRLELGELGIRVWLESQLAPEWAFRAAEGWDGDLAVLDSRAATPDEAKRGATSRPGITFLSTWDSVADADEFVDALGAWLWKVGRRTGIEDWSLSQQGPRVRLSLTLELVIPELIDGLSDDPWSRVEFPAKTGSEKDPS